MIVFKKRLDMGGLVIVMGFAILLINLFVGWFIWVKTQDAFTTALAVVLVTLSFFFSPAAKKRMY